jgi:hypothetical protein
VCLSVCEGVCVCLSVCVCVIDRGRSCSHYLAGGTHLHTVPTTKCLRT